MTILYIEKFQRIHKKDTRASKLIQQSWRRKPTHKKQWGFKINWTSLKFKVFVQRTLSRNWKVDFWLYLNERKCLQVISSLFFLFWFSHYVYATPKCPMWSEVTQSCPTLCDPMDCSPPGSSVHGIFQAWILEWGAISFSRGSSRPRDGTWVSCIVGRRFIAWATREV